MKYGDNGMNNMYKYGDIKYNYNTENISAEIFSVENSSLDLFLLIIILYCI